MLRQRLLTVLVLGPIGIAAILLMPPTFIWYLLALLLGLAAWEWVQFANIGHPTPRIAAGLAVAVTVALPLRQVSAETALAISVAAYLAWIAAIAWLKFRGFGARGTRLERAFKLLVGLLVFLTCALAMGNLFTGPQGRQWVLVMLLVIWAADSGAYFFGRRYGRRKLAPAISPGKTWEGVYGGLFTVAAVTSLAGIGLGLSAAMVVGLILVALGTAMISVVGDLLASLLKRQVGLKDSSRLLPGHGGMIDRFDSLMAAAPAFFVGIAWLGV